MDHNSLNRYMVCMFYVCMCTYICMYFFFRVHVYVYMHVFFVCMCTYICMYFLCACMHVCIHVSMYVRMAACMQAGTRACVNVRKVRTYAWQEETEQRIEVNK